MSHLDKKVFGKKTYSNLLKEIYDNQKKKEGQIAALISELKPLIQDIGDATMIVPLIKEYMELGIKNDEALIKVAICLTLTRSCFIRPTRNSWKKHEVN